MMKNFGLRQTKGSNPVQGAIFNLSNFSFTKRDLSRNVRLPNFLTKQLAEDIGIHIGDGCLSVQEKKDHAIFCSGNYNDDKIYLDSYVAPLKEILYGIMPSKLKKKNEYCLTIRSKIICKFYSEILKLPIGSKNEISIPDMIIDSEYLTDCLRGIIDTDFSLMFKNKGNG